MEDWKNMLDFAIELVLESRRYDEDNRIFGERITILHLDHANELFMKSFLIKKGYIINYLDKDELKKGVKRENLLDKDKTMEYLDCLNLVSREINFAEDKKEKIKKFHKLRNEIQHRATNLPLNKGEEIENFMPILKELFTLMFPEFMITFPYLFD